MNLYCGYTLIAPAKGICNTEKVHVDVSWRSAKITIGMFIARKGLCYIFSTDSRLNSTGAAEYEAILLANKLFPGIPIHGDHGGVVNKVGKQNINNFILIPRAYNLAHPVARKKRNFIERDAIDEYGVDFK